MRPLLCITSLMCEATPLIEGWGLKPLREHPFEERFQLFHSNGVYVAVSGIGKLRSAVACATLITRLYERHPGLCVMNLGIAGATPEIAPIGTLVQVHKVRDVSTNTRFYPDIILKHPLPELPLDTHDHPVTSPHGITTLVDMECAGFMQAATTLLAPSLIAVLKVVSDHCDGTRTTPTEVITLLSLHLETITSITQDIRQALPEPPRLTEDERELLDIVTRHARLTTTRRIELTRHIQEKKARHEPFIDHLRAILNVPITTKDAQRAAYEALLKNLMGDALP